MYLFRGDRGLRSHDRKQKVPGFYAAKRARPGGILRGACSFSYRTTGPADCGTAIPSAQDFLTGLKHRPSRNWMGTDETRRDILYRNHYGRRISLRFCVRGYFG